MIHVKRKAHGWLFNNRSLLGRAIAQSRLDFIYLLHSLRDILINLVLMVVIISQSTVDLDQVKNGNCRWISSASDP